MYYSVDSLYVDIHLSWQVLSENIAISLIANGMRIRLWY